MSNEIVAQSVDPMQLLAAAVSSGADIDKLTKLMDLQERWEAANAQKAFTAAMAKFKECPPKLVKDKNVSFGNTKYKHAELDQVTDKVAAALSAVGISHRFEIDQSDSRITVSCILTHVAGHSVKTTLGGGADSSGGKNSIQAIGSTVSYLQRYTLLAATGLATGEGDDDGRSAEIERINDEQHASLDAFIKETNSNLKAFLDYFKVEKLEDLQAKSYDEAMGLLRKKWGRK